ncbi:PREDICTED: protein FAR1-RELATED SEQUENCE 5-like [Ipomoea nil]|uniref:protein FAR1-RELATED SEQUENCE 5-like n=1 Tax=Ipomoea nil TaxID=35883 RepID=UPI000901E599|nr:PREDICTED: protein FAR1-RELATED SEQUENCE 5-like [Ipomoea nil]
MTSGHDDSSCGSHGRCVMGIPMESAKYWAPECDPSIEPIVGQRFATLNDGVEFYSQYASVVGFDIRHGSEKRDEQGEIVLKYVLCSRQDFKQSGGEGSGEGGVPEVTSTPSKKHKVSNRVACYARIEFMRVRGGGYKVFSLEKQHNHCLCSEVARPFLKVNLKLDIGQKNFLACYGKENIGPMKSFKIYKEGGSDAQLVLEKYLQKQEFCPGFFFDYDVDENNQLCRVFWADPVAQRNFSCFGEAVSFDVMYCTTRYNMVFVSFTGVDHHKKCVTFAAGLIAKKDVESYVWLLENFKHAMGHVPPYMVTNQDPAIKVAVSRVFSSTRHRFRMWHIMSKVGEKVGPVLAKDESFRHDLDAVVWNECLTVEEFESRWRVVMEQYRLIEHRWFCHMFDLRAYWIPAFFRDTFMAGLFQMNSRYEEENSVFGSCTNLHSTLVEFFIHFEGAIDNQRHTHATLNANCDGNFPKLKTPLMIERHAAAVYTTTLFYEVQSEIYDACFWPRILSNTHDGDLRQFVVEDEDVGSFNVVLNVSDNSVECSCRMFHRVGLKSGPGVDGSIGVEVANLSSSSNVVIQPPTIAKNKVSGKRLKSEEDSC